jgi:hypothetical protein
LAISTSDDIRDLDNDHRFGSAQILREKNVKSVCCLPLSTVHQNLGTLNLWNDKIGAYDNFTLNHRMRNLGIMRPQPQQG